MPQNIEARDIFKSLQDIEMKQLLSYSKEGVLPLVPIPRNWIGYTVDDLTTVIIVMLSKKWTFWMDFCHKPKLIEAMYLVARHCSQS